MGSCPRCAGLGEIRELDIHKLVDFDESYNKRNYLNDVNVTGIYYNYDREYLVVAYANSNMDVIDSDGRVTNVSDIKDASLSSSK